MWVGVHAACMCVCVCVCVCVCEGEEEHCAACTINSRVTLDYLCLYVCVMLACCTHISQSGSEGTVLRHCQPTTRFFIST